MWALLVHAPSHGSSGLPCSDWGGGVYRPEAAPLSYVPFLTFFELFPLLSFWAAGGHWLEGDGEAGREGMDVGGVDRPLGAQENPGVSGVGSDAA